MNSKSAWERPALAWIERIEYHLTNEQSAALAANDADAYQVYEQSINAVAVFVYLLKRDEQHTRRKRREEMARLRELRNRNVALVKRLAETESLELPLAA